MFENGETHRCGACNNPTGVYNKECPGRRKGIRLVGAPRPKVTATA